MEIKNLLSEKQKELVLLNKQLSELREEYYNEKLAKSESLERTFQDLVYDYNNKNFKSLITHIESMRNLLNVRFIAEPSIDPYNDMVKYVKTNRAYWFDTRYGIRTGIRRGNVCAVGAEPGAGKTTFLINIARDCVKSKLPCLFHSLELPAEDILVKMCQMAVREKMLETLDYWEVQREIKNSNSKYKEVFQAEIENSKKYLLIVDESRLRASEIVQYTESARDYFDGSYPAVRIIDYIGIMKGETHTDRMEKRHQIDETMSIITADSKKNKITTFIISQLSRDSQRKNRSAKNKEEKIVESMPSLNDFKESGGIESDAGVAMILTRPRYTTGEYKDQIKIWVVKNRYGSLEKKTILIDPASGYYFKNADENV